jgi:hypothetical protein
MGVRKIKCNLKNLSRAIYISITTGLNFTLNKTEVNLFFLGFELNDVLINLFNILKVEKQLKEDFAQTYYLPSS